MRRRRRRAPRTQRGEASALPQLGRMPRRQDHRRDVLERRATERSRIASRQEEEEEESMSSRSKHYTTTVRPLVLAFSSTRFLRTFATDLQELVGEASHGGADAQAVKRTILPGKLIQTPPQLLVGRALVDGVLQVCSPSCRWFRLRPAHTLTSPRPTGTTR